MNEISIIGAGLAGSLLSLLLADRGYRVKIYESRADLRLLPQDYGRSINLALSKRGITSLEQVGLMDKVRAIVVPMRGRAIHEMGGGIKYQPFGRHSGEYINAVKRSELNALLLDEIDKHENIDCMFHHKLISVDFSKKELIFEHKGRAVTHSFVRLIGADGAGSMVRQAMQEQGLIEASRRFLPHSYKELSIDKPYDELVAKEHLHLWARNSFLLLGNPNPDKSLTGTLFMEDKGAVSFETVNSAEKVEHLFQRYFSDVYRHMTHLKSEFIENPTGRLSTIKVAPWFVGDSCLLIGDAAHGIVPFFGQGMNSAFEDCRILNELLDRHRDDWKRVMVQFYQARKLNTDAIASMSMDNYREIEREVCEEQFNLRKHLEFELMVKYPNVYQSKHVMVMFTNLPYAYAQACGVIQQELLNDICGKIDSLGQLNWRVVDEKLNIYDKKLTALKRQFEMK